MTTTKEAFSSAMMLLQAYGLPREKFDSLGDVFRKEGFVSSPLEERARLNHALSQEISHTVSSIDGVVMARVHLVVPERMQLDNVVKPSSASVFVKHRPDIDLQNHIGKIKAMVVNGVENLPVENVTVALFPTEPLLMGPSSIERKPIHMEEVSPGNTIRSVAGSGFASMSVLSMSLLPALLLLLALLGIAYQRYKKRDAKPDAGRDARLDASSEVATVAAKGSSQ